MQHSKNPERIDCAGVVDSSHTWLCTRWLTTDSYFPNKSNVVLFQFSPNVVQNNFKLRPPFLPDIIFPALQLPHIRLIFSALFYRSYCGNLPWQSKRTPNRNRPYFWRVLTLAWLDYVWHLWFSDVPPTDNAHLQASRRLHRLPQWTDYILIPAPLGAQHHLPNW